MKPRFWHSPSIQPCNIYSTGQTISSLVVYRRPRLEKTTANATQLKRVDGTSKIETPPVFDVVAPVAVVDVVLPDTSRPVEVGIAVSVSIPVAFPVVMGESRADPVIGAAF